MYMFICPDLSENNLLVSAHLFWVKISRKPFSCTAANWGVTVKVSQLIEPYILDLDTPEKIYNGQIPYQNPGQYLQVL